MKDPSYLEGILRKTSIVSITTGDGQWRRQIELPSITPTDGEVFKIFFDIRSTFDVVVIKDGKEARLKNGMKREFENASGKWIEGKWTGNSGNKSMCIVYLGHICDF